MLAGCDKPAPARHSQPAAPAAAMAPARAAPAGYTLPALTGRVVDAAGLLSADNRIAITGKLAALEQSTGHQFVVVTVKDIGKHSIEDYGRTLGDSWGIGRKGVNDGVLLVVAVAQRQVRIVVGDGLIKALPNSQSKAIIENRIVPAFRAGDFPRGIANGVDGVIGQISNRKLNA